MIKVGSLLREVSRLSSRRLAAFSSWSSANSRLASSSADEDDAEETGVVGGSGTDSETVRRALTDRRPDTVIWAPRLANSVQLIGSVDRPVETLKSQKGDLGAYTTLRVKNPLNSKQLTYTIMIVAWGDLAEICVKHVKPGDFLSVSGLLGSYSKSDAKEGYGGREPKIIVRDLNFVDVSLHGNHHTSTKPGVCDSEAHHQNDESSAASKADLELYQNHLWQDFFRNRERWWDNRTSKKHNWWPDFIHKNTREGLWLTPDVPPWVKEQLQLLDSNTAEQDQGNGAQGTDIMEGGFKNALYLWQLLFRSPNEWWDNRLDKRNPRAPDFKHKDTGEALWIRRDHPLWVKRQLELLDSRMAERGEVIDND
ncbi:unnamed protein product [Linum tenue]|uniref:Uncharacterized protein n=1 Tax=Linum tenue TaxID=586396 RepID=A0AAV0RPZ2_9ROSI|nr:unnamed protein product [Linum tenue]